jgi:fission process protein 1
MTASEKPLEAIQNKVDTLADKNVDTVDSDLRYMAYGARIRTALRASTRYIAYVRTRYWP